jgi:hypothetical protein
VGWKVQSTLVMRVISVSQPSVRAAEQRFAVAERVDSKVSPVSLTRKAGLKKLQRSAHHIAEALLELHC